MDVQLLLFIVILDEKEKLSSHLIFQASLMIIWLDEFYSIKMISVQFATKRKGYLQILLIVSLKLSISVFCRTHWQYRFCISTSLNGMTWLVRIHIANQLVRDWGVVDVVIFIDSFFIKQTISRCFTKICNAKELWCILILVYVLTHSHIFIPFLEWKLRSVHVCSKMQGSMFFNKKLQLFYKNLWCKKGLRHISWLCWCVDAQFVYSFLYIVTSKKCSHSLKVQFSVFFWVFSLLVVLFCFVLPC